MQSRMGKAGKRSRKEAFPVSGGSRRLPDPAQVSSRIAGIAAHCDRNWLETYGRRMGTRPPQGCSRGRREGSMRKHFVVWAALAQLLPLLAIGDGSVSLARAVDECRSGPGGPSPSGSHWYYRIDRATKRKCWYLGPLGHKTARASAPR